MKRKQDADVDIKYAVVETTEDNATYVEFMPQLWLVPAKKKPAIKERDFVNFYFPLRLANQSKDKYIKFVKQAKFICMKPEDDGNWDLKEGRVLKLDLDSLESALDSQKLYSDYFSTTEAELEIQEPAPEPVKKCIRKKKKILSKTNNTYNNSESDDEHREVATISNYNVRYQTESQDMFTLDEANNIFPINYQQLMDNSLLDLENGSSSQFNIESDRNVLTLDGMLNEPSNEMFLTIQVPTNQVPANEPMNEVATGNIEIDQQMELTSNENNHQQINCLQSSCCKGMQKVLNKVDYFQKKAFKEIDLLRQEVALNNKLLLQLINSQQQSVENTENHQDEQSEEIQDEQAQLNLIETDSFNEKYKSIFPIQNFEILIDFNNSMKSDLKFLDNMYSKLKKIKAEDEIKTTRKILKELCDFRCLKDFTWLGTKDKKGVIKMQSFEKLHLIVDLITKILDANYPNCNSLITLTKVVQQRTKSAKEAFTKLMEQTALESSKKVEDSVHSKDVSKKSDSPNTEHGAVVSTDNTVVNNESDSASCPVVIGDTSG